MTRALVLGLSLLLALPSAAGGESYAFMKVADQTSTVYGCDTTAEFGAHSMNASGRLAWLVAFTGGGEGIFTGNGGGATTLIADSCLGFSNLSFPSINGAGTVAFRTNLGSGVGIFAGTAVPVGMLYSDSGVFAGFSNPGSTAFLNDTGTGTVVFPATLDAGGAGLFTGSGGATTTIVDTTGPFTSFDHGVINDAGTVAFLGVKNGVSGIYRGSGAAPTTIAEVGPDFSGFAFGPSINFVGTVAFQGSLTAGGEGIFLGSGGAITTVVDSSGPFSNFQDVVINAAGVVAFSACLDAGGCGIFTGPDPIANKVIAVGDPLFGSTVTALLFRGAFNDAGQVAFVADLANGNQAVARADPVGPAADLKVSSLSAPASSGAGKTIAITTVVLNAGTQAAPSTTTRFYVSADKVWDPGDAPLGSRVVPALSPGATDGASTPVTFDAGLASGTWFIIARADADGDADESSETNNAKSKSIKIGPDLTVTLAAPKASEPGAVISVTDTTKNKVGGGSAGESITRFYLSTNSSLGGDVELGNRNVPALNPGQPSAGPTSLTISSDTALGTYFIIAQADATNLVDEFTETNNTKSKSIRIGADLIVSALSAPVSAVAGSMVSITSTTKNQGGATAGASTTSFYLSSDGVVSGDDVPLGSLAVGSLNPNISQSGSISGTIPPGTAPGPYFIIAVADDGGLVPEASETNNTKTKSITVTAP